MFKENLPKRIFYNFLENFGPKNLPIWAAHTRTLNILCCPLPGKRTRIEKKDSVQNWLLDISQSSCLLILINIAKFPPINEGWGQSTHSEGHFWKFRFIRRIIVGL